MSLAEPFNFPEWTEYSSTSGQDPLGMQSTSINLYQSLVPGIGNVTLRMRYYGLYAWLSQSYARRVGDTNPKSWQRYIRRTEALYALIAARRGGETGVAGGNWARRKLSKVAKGSIDFSRDAELERPNYFAVTWGAYGLAYGSQLSQVRILCETAAHGIPVPSEGAGEKLATAFEQELGELAAPFQRSIERARVTHSDLERFGRLSPSGIRKTGAERSLYEDVLFARDGLGGDDADSRRASLVLILKLTAQLKRSPTPDDVRWVLYAGKDGNGQPFYAGGAALQNQQRRWHDYHANDLCHVTLEALLKFTLDKLGEYPRGIAAQVLIRRCADDIAGTGTAPASWGAFVRAVAEAPNAYDAQSGASEWNLAQEMLAASGALEICSADTALKALVLLALLHRRFRADSGAATSELAQFDPVAFHSLLTESRFLDQLTEEPFARAVARILEERVMRRHLWVAMRKLRHQGDYTFLVDTDDGLLRLRKKDGPIFTNPRLGPAIRFLRDIHLIDDDGLTPRGAKVLQSS
ncbi:MAG TPA: hypothetical protein VG889_00910 [Rhizomicrobium sp.]|nr:hypothetical protein [Rhizomicrobium sp.]